MNLDIIKGNWKQLKGKIQKEWGKISHDEIEQMKGSYEELVGFLQKKYGYEKVKAQSEIERFIRDNDLAI